MTLNLLSVESESFKSLEAHIRHIMRGLCCRMLLFFGTSNVHALTVQATMGRDLSNQNIVNNSPAMEDDMPSLTTPPPSDSDSDVSMMDLSEVD